MAKDPITASLAGTTDRQTSSSRLLKLEKHLRMEKVLASIAMRMSVSENVDDAIHASLAEMGELVDADRAYVFRLRDNGALMDNTHEWCATGISGEIDNLQNLPSDSLPWFMRKLSEGVAFQIPDVSMLPPEAETEQKILEAQNIRSCLFMPMQINGNLTGFIGFDNIRNVLEWREKDIQVLRIAARLMSDFYDRQAARRALELSRQRQMAVLDNIPDIAWLKDREGRFIYANEAFTYAAGVSAGDLVHRTDAEIWPREQATRYLRDDAEVMETGHSKRIEEPFIDENGRERLVETIRTPIKDADGELIGTTGISRDITERKQAEIALQRSERRYRRLAESIPAILYRYSKGKGANYWSPQVEMVLGFSEHDLKEQPFLWHDSIHPEDVAMVDRAIAEFRVGFPINLVYRISDVNGNWLWFHDRSIGRVEQDGEVVIEGIATDISELKHAELALKENERSLRLIVENQTDMVVKVGMDGRFEFVSPSYCTLFGKRESELIGNKFMPLVHEDDRQATAEAMQALQHPPYECYVEQRARTAAGWRWLAWADKAILDEAGRPVSIVGVGRDISEKKALEEALYNEREKALVTLRSIGDAVISTDAKGIVEFMNPVAEYLTGWFANEAEGRHLSEVFHVFDQETREPVRDPVALCLSEGKVTGLAMRAILLSRSGDEFAVEDSVAPILTDSGEVLGVVLVFKDVSEARQLAQQVSYQATHDALTGLVNRAEIEHLMQRVLETAHADSTQNAFCYLDLDQFKLVNDTCGHLAGDELLRHLGKLLQQHIRKRDTLARLGGDEFGLLMEHCSLKDARLVAEKLINVLGEFSFPWGNHSFRVGASVGLVAIDHESKNIADVLRAADSACYVAKEQGRNRIHVHQKDDEELARRDGEMQWAVRLPRALENDRFQLYFQPIVPVHAEENEVTGHYELLLRMEDESGELRMPGAFLPAAERYNLSDSIDRWVIKRALLMLRENPDHLEKLHLCSINLSGHSLNNKTFLQFVTDQLATSAIPPSKVCFEITETAAIANMGSAIAFITAMKALGCCFALDDFGSGLSSFAYLKNLPVDFLKIDGLFVKDILEDPMDLAMVKSINEISHVMGKKTIAEFVENAAILDKLKEIGVDYAQGYGVGRPAPFHELLAK